MHGFFSKFDVSGEMGSLLLKADRHRHSERHGLQLFVLVHAGSLSSVVECPRPPNETKFTGPPPPAIAK